MLNSRNLIEKDKEGKTVEAIGSIVEIADDAIISLDSSQNIILFNQGAEKIFGYKSEEILGRPLDLLIPLKYVAQHKHHVENFTKANVAARRMAERANIGGRRKDGTEFPAEASISKVKKGDEYIYTVILRDVTERKKAEEDLLHYSQELARSNRDLEQFMYVASHDLQEPLRMVSNFCQLLKEDYKDKIDSAGLEYIDFAVDGAHRMKRLIEDLLAYSRVQRSQSALKEVNCETVLNRVLHDLDLRIHELGAKITHDPLPTVLGDEIQLGQLFLNLLSNAMKFCDRPPEIHVGVKETETDWVISVKDNGIGIDSRFFEKIFLIFQRLHTSDKYPGTGIGLALCKKIVERHHGRIWVESTPGAGTTIFVSFPRVSLSNEA